MAIKLNNVRKIMSRQVGKKSGQPTITKCFLEPNHTGILSLPHVHLQLIY